MPFIEINNFPAAHTHELEARVETLEDHMEILMAKIDDLNADLAGTQTDVDAIKAYIINQQSALASLQDQLTQLEQSTPPQVDLSGAIAAADALKAEADAIVASFTPAPAVDPTPADPPVSEPSAPSSTDTTVSSDTPSPDVQP